MFALHMGWRHLLFANWPVPPDVVEPRIPEALSVDTYDGRAWLSVVPFVNVDVRPRRVPAGLGFRLPELNLRTYVTHGRNDGAGDSDGQPGVYFFSLDAGGPSGAGPSAMGLRAVGLLGVAGARLLHHLPYYYAAIDFEVGDDGRVGFESQRRHPGARPVHFAATYGPTATTDDGATDASNAGDPPPGGPNSPAGDSNPPGESLRAEPGSLAEFLTERYRYYTEAPSGEIRYADVDHERWPLFRADADIAENTLFRANGFAHPEGEPRCYYSPGMDVLASRSRRLSR